MGTKQLVSTTINGEPRQLLCEARQSLLEALRDEVGLTGCKEGCNNGNCGACSVLLDGQPVNSCLVFGLEVDGKEITTIEGLGASASLHEVQQAFYEESAGQCGYCIPGTIMSVKALLDRKSAPNDTEIRESLSAHLCRCGSHHDVLKAVLNVLAKKAK